MSAPGETVALFGPNGAGKTTLMNTIIGERRPVSGSITFQGRRIERLSVHAIIRPGIGIVPQGGSVMARQSVEDNLLISMTGLRLGGRGTAGAALRRSTRSSPPWRGAASRWARA